MKAAAHRPTLRQLALLAGIALVPGCGTETTSTELKEGNHYYVYVDHVEVQANKPNGKPWDIDKSAPDIFYTVSWQGNRIFKSPELGNTLVAEWKATEMGLGLGKQNLIKGESSPLAGRITARSGEVTIEFFDGDVAFEDDIARFDLQIDDLKVGRNNIPGTGSIETLVVVIAPIPPIEDR